MLCRRQVRCVLQALVLPVACMSCFPGFCILEFFVLNPFFISLGALLIAWPGVLFAEWMMACECACAMACTVVRSAWYMCIPRRHLNARVLFTWKPFVILLSGFLIPWPGMQGVGMGLWMYGSIKRIVHVHARVDIRRHSLFDLVFIYVCVYSQTHIFHALKLGVLRVGH